MSFAKAIYRRNGMVVGGMSVLTRRGLKGMPRQVMPIRVLN